MTENQNLQNLPNLALIDLEGKIRQLAEGSKDDLWGLLEILRSLETVHRQIREELFEPSLPDNRQKLYQFLKEVDETGGWPYISRMRLQTLFKNYAQAEAEREQNQQQES